MTTPKLLSVDRSKLKPFASDIQKEIDFIEELLIDSQGRNSLLYKIAQKQQLSENMISKANEANFEEIELRLQNLTQQIFTLQMRQFAESISRVQKCKNKNIFRISFDPEEKIDSIILNEKDYKQLLSFRDPFHCSNVTESFIADEGTSFHSRPKSKKEPTKKNFKYFVGKFVLPSYNVCHHCKLLKQSEDLVKCQMCNTKNKIPNRPEIQVKVMFANQGIILKKDKIYLLKHYDGNIRELIDEYFSYKKHNTHSCDKYYCRSCLRLSYDMNLDAKSEKNFICPSCRDHCSCSRCFRYEQLIKIIACYITLSGDINKLYDFLTESNSIMELLKENLVLSKFVIFDMSDRSSSEKIKQNKIVNLDSLSQYKKILEGYQGYFSAAYDKIKNEFLLNRIDKEISDESSLLSKKRKKEPETKRRRRS